MMEANASMLNNHQIDQRRPFEAAPDATPIVTPEVILPTLGRKGAETRGKLMTATAELLKTTALRDLRASAISRYARVAVGTFYIYFENVEALALALSWQVAEQAHYLAKLLRQPWYPGNAAPIEDFIRAYFAFWDEHGPILRVRNLADAGGDETFLEARLQMEVPLYRLLDAKVREAKDRGAVAAAENEIVVSGLLLGSLDHQASLSHFIDFDSYGMSRESLISGAIFLFSKTLFAPTG